jgi:hypothetical protein
VVPVVAPVVSPPAPVLAGALTLPVVFAPAPVAEPAPPEVPDVEAEPAPAPVVPEPTASDGSVERPPPVSAPVWQAPSASAEARMLVVMRIRTAGAPMLL